MRYLLLALALLCFNSYAEQSITFGVHSKTAPLEWRNNGVDQGFNIELMDRIGQLTNRRIIVRRKSFQELVSDVHNPDSDIDVIAVVSPVNLGRQLSQSDPIYATHAKAYTLHGKGYINDWQDLIGKRVAIKKGAFVDVYLSGYPQEFERVDVDLYETGFQLMTQGKVDVVLAESFVARRLLPLYPAIRSGSDALIYGAFNFVANNQRSALMTEINDALRQLKLSGEYDALVNKWFGTGREKVDLTSTQKRTFALAIVVSIISAIGMIFTGFVSISLRKQKRALKTELAQRLDIQRQLVSLSKQFQSVLDGIPNGVTIYSHDMQKLWSNDNNIELLSSAEFHHEDGRPLELQDLVTQVLAKQSSQIEEMAYLQQFWQLQVHPIADNQVVILLEDTTEAHQLRQANDEASRLASLGELSAGIAHEINNPTGLIVHSISQLQQAMADCQPAFDSYQKQNPFWLITGLPPEQALAEASHSCNTIEEGAQRISRIVSDLKRYALPTLSSEQERVSLNEVVNVSLRLTANQIKTFQVSIQLSQPAAWVYGDAQQLQQVVINLIQNACHACESGKGHIVIETRIADEQAIISITDNGCGMNRSTLARVTEPFFTTRRSVGGSGLGLSVCSRIVKAHNGELQMTSKIKQGTCIKVRLPLAKEESN
ncbi:transporter substrate-binding domain-containing protein [Shewanella sp. Scap07]|uniref:ATP-binding protein n=1 Tax=Shewanella sp. Scap07 TaxID=2589987 RepID=UPI0015B8611A|nr:ATP-binding protein [Shewanella sp. Scap07]QLE84262.1 transporter substrate-binding domain-containing protein [Shewanella sp. Scap07]